MSYSVTSKFRNLEYKRTQLEDCNFCIHGNNNNSIYVHLGDSPLFDRKIRIDRNLTISAVYKGDGHIEHIELKENNKLKIVCILNSEIHICKFYLPFKSSE